MADAYTVDSKGRGPGEGSDTTSINTVGEKKQVRIAKPKSRKLKPLFESDSQSMEEGRNRKDPIQHSRASLTAPAQAKICYFYKDDDYTFQSLKVAVSDRKYKRLDTLFSELSKRMPGLNYGVRSVFTPKGRDKVESFDQLTNDQKYICSTQRHTLKGLDINKVDNREIWHATRPPSGRRAYNRLVRDSRLREGRFRKTGKRDPQMAYAYYSSMPKKVTIMRNGDPTNRHVMIFNRRTAQTFEQVLNDIGGTVKFAARHLYNIEGKEVKSLQQLMTGPDILIVGGKEPFRAMEGVSFTPRQSRLALSRGGLSTGGGSDMIARKMQERRERLKKTQGRWKVLVQTNKHPSTGTPAQVTLTVYGHKGNSGPIALGNGDGTQFKSGNLDTFDVSVGSIGEIYKIRIGHDNSGDNPGWLCDEVKMMDTHTAEELRFECHRWMARDEDDMEICREMPAVRKREPILPVMRYEVSVHTGSLWNAGTDANVYMTVYGDRGDTGVRQLFSKAKNAVFQQGQEDMFTLEAVSLGRLKRVIIGHDGTGSGNGWFLEKVVIREPNSKATDDYTFYCGKWLDEGEDDGKIVRELKVQEEYMDDILEKRNWEYEMWKFQKDGKVKFYSLVTHKAVRTKSNLTVDALADDFDNDAVYNVVVKKKTMVRAFSSVTKPKNFLAIDNGKITMQGMGGPYCEFRVRVQHDRSVMLESMKNPLQFVTFGEDGQPDDVRGVLDKEPTRRFFVYCKGMFRHRGIVMLCSSFTQAITINHDYSMQATGKQNKMAQFRVHKISTGGIRMFESMMSPGKFIRMKDGKIDCMGERNEYSHFMVEKHRDQGYVSLQSVTQRGLYLGMKPDGRVWPTVDTGVNNIWLYPSVIEFGVPKLRSTEQVEENALMQSRQTDSVMTVDMTPTPTPTPRVDFAVGDWSINISTKDTLKNGDIALVVYGDRGNSGAIPLGAPSKEIFQEGNKDEFRANLQKVGTIKKIRLELTPKGTDASWKVDDVVFENLTSNEVLEFNFNKWLSTAHEDQQNMREMPVTKQGTDSRNLIKYKVRVQTGNEIGSETEASVYFNLFGDDGDIGKRLLLKSSNKQKFRRGQVDVFEVEAVSIGRPQRCIVGHEETADGQGWYLDQIVVQQGDDAQEKYIFECDRWLDTGQEDRRIERTLTLKDSQVTEVKPVAALESVAETIEDLEEETKEEIRPETFRDGDWRLYVTTGSDAVMGTTNGVSLYVYGTSGVMGPISLGQDDEEPHFDSGVTDEFKVFIGPELGDLYKLRIGHDDKDTTSGWFLQTMKMINIMTSEEHVFNLHRWMSRSRDDRDVWREIPVSTKGKPLLPVITYTVQVHTGSQLSSGSTADVFVCMHGQRGDTGRRKLVKSETTDSAVFQQGTMDVFHIEAVSLGELKKITIGHNNKGDDPGWFLDKVVVKEAEKNDAEEIFFPCNRWLDENQDDGKCEIDLIPQKPVKKSEGEYKVWIQTGEESKPSNGGTVSMVVYGENGKTDQIKLFAPNPTAKLFEPGNIDQFEVEVGDIGELYKIRTVREDTPKWEGWYLREVKLQDNATQEDFVFGCNRWLARDQDDFDVVREFPVVKANKTPPSVFHYEVTVYVGENWAAGTDSSVFINIFGKKGDTGRRLLYHSKSNSQPLQRGQVDTFLFEAVALDNLTHIEIGHDTKGHGAGLFIDQVTVSETDGPSPTSLYVFPCRRWLDQREGDGRTWRTLPVLDIRDSTKPAKQKNLAKKTKGKYNIVIKTSERPGSGTRAQVFITAEGTKGKADRQPLGNVTTNEVLFDEGVTSEFNMDFGEIGDLTKIQLDHANQNPNPSWHVDWIKLTDIDTEEEMEIFVDRWFARDEDDGQISREFPIVRKGKIPLPDRQYVIEIQTGNYPEVSVAQGKAFLTLTGSDGDTGKRPLDKPFFNSSQLWRPGQVDVFIIEAVSVGKMQTLQLQFEGKGKDKVWFVERVSVFEGLSAVSQIVFNCQHWIDVNAVIPDKFKVSEILPSLCPNEITQKWFKDVQPLRSSGQWSLQVFCGQQTSGATTEEVYCVVYGLNGQTDQIHLNADHQFTRGAVVKLEVNLGDIGAIYKIRVYFGGDYTGAAWFLHKLKLRDHDTGEEFSFVYDGELEGTEDNADGTVELAAIRPDQEPLQDNEYTLYVATGNEEQSGTEADVFCDLIGQWGNTGKRLLRKSKSAVPFKQGQVDEFTISGLDLGEIKKVMIGHSEKGRGKGWLCARVLVKSSLNEDLRIFPCNRWMDSGCEDRRLVRELLPLGAMPLTQSPDGKSEGQWTVQVWSADRSLLPKSAEELSSKSRSVSLTVYGKDGVEGPVELTNEEQERFLPGMVNKFPAIDLSKVGDLHKIRVSSGLDEDPNPVWTISKLVLTDSVTEEQLLFDFSGWVGEEGGDIRKELPVIKMGKGYKQVVPYYVEVYTSEEEMNAGTKANVYLTLYGQQFDSGRRHLTKSHTNKTKFQTGQVDIFRLEAVDLGELAKVVVEKGPGDPWLLEKATVKAGEFKNIEYIFDYNKWVGTKEEKDKEAEVNIRITKVEPSTVVLPYGVDYNPTVSKGSWTVETETGGQKGGDSASDIVMVMCGDKGEARPTLLKSTRDNAFQIGMTDTCKLTLSDDIGELYKVRIGFQDNSQPKGWYLRKIKCEDNDTGDIFTYELNDWVTVDDKLDGWREFPVVWPAILVPQVMRYQVYVHLGQVRKPVEDVYIYLYGDRGGTGKRSLKHSLSNTDKFQHNQVDQFEVEAVSLGDLQKVTIGHGTLVEGSGWFLKKVVVMESDETIEEAVFTCNRWLDTGEEDGKVERTLYITEGSVHSPSPVPVVAPVIQEKVDSPKPESEKGDNSSPKPDTPEPEQTEQEVKKSPTPPPPPPPKGNPWSVTTVTGSESGQGTVAAMALVVYGDKGHSEPVVIGEDPDFRFYEGKTDEHEVRMEAEVGVVYKVRVGFHGQEHDLSWYEDSATAPSWFAEEIKLTNLTSNEVYTFDSKSWVKLDGKDDFWREFPVKQEKDELSVKQYYVQVYTGDKFKAGTDANVFLQLFGARGDTGRRMLLTSRNNANKFEQGSVDIFEIEAVDLDNLTKVKVGHDGSNAGSGWYLDKVVVREFESAKESFVFQCDKWLDTGEDDQEIVRELTLTEVAIEEEKPPSPKGVPWKICTVTGEEAGQGTGSAAVVVIYGSKGQTDPKVIGESEEFRFEMGKTDEFKVHVEEDIGEVYKVRVGFHSSEHDLMWYESPDSAPSWFLKQMTLTNMKSDVTLTFPGDQWIKLDGFNDYWKEFAVKADSAEDQLTGKTYSLEVHTGDKFQAGTDANVFVELFGERGNTGRRRLLTSRNNANKFEQGARDLFEVEAVDLGKLTKVVVGHDGENPGSGWYLDNVTVSVSDKPTHKFIFKCEKWLDVGEDDAVIVRDLPLTNEEEVQEEAPKQPPKEGDFRVFIITGREPKSATTAQVTLTVYGDAGNSGPLQLGKADSGQFQVGQTDEFDISLDPEDLGEFRKIRVEHDNSGSDPAWWLDKVILHDLVKDEKLQFDVDRWLSYDDKGGDIVVEVPVKHPKHDAWPVNKYVVQTTTGNEAGSGSDANVYINLFGTLGDSGKRYLKNNREGGNTFETGKVDTFVVEAVELGRLETIVIGHDSSGSDPAWLVERVTVMESDDAEKRYLFPCGSWLKDENNVEPVELELYMDRMEKVEIVSSDLNVNGNQGGRSTQEQSQQQETEEGKQEEKEGGEGETEGDTEGDQKLTEGDQGEAEGEEDTEGGHEDQQTDGEKGENDQDETETKEETNNKERQEEDDGKTEDEDKKDDENQVENNEGNDGKTDETKPEDTPKKEEND
ncbi:lipoxygenase homology domain-containing protein 1-like isoform X2 [Mizuhopecten yessoensis]|uniref:lipoxygenase homology domain-containing protein 1-like isoform X2 n=1 Tax=Mizuhopecten yessoensis TaxID=6573 RepID=UPI000B45B17A|nr:lipoxygenase homology domain-containing protein 1-like isoform X2 [Mizuhopecten yessoensis]